MFCEILLIACSKTVLQEKGYELYELHPETQHIKLFSQIEDMCQLLEENLHMGNMDRELRLSMVQGSSTFHLRDRTTLVASVCIVRNTYFSMRSCGCAIAVSTADIVGHDVLEVYSFVVDEKYRGKGIAGAFLDAAIVRMKERLSLDENTYIGLHLNPKDRMMWFSFALYVRYGFTKACICRYGPSDMKFYGERIMRLQHPLQAAMEVISGEKRGNFLALYTRIKHFRRRKPSMEMQDLFMVGKALQKMLGAGRSKKEL